MVRTTWLALSVLAFLLAACPAFVQGGDDDMVDHPFYKHWANCKPNSTVTLTEKTVFHGPEKNQLPDGIDEKIVTRKLLSVNAKGVVVQTITSEHDFLGMIESAPTKATYAAKIKKSHLQAALHNINAKPGEDTVTFNGKKIACKTLEGVEKKEGSTIEHKVWISDTVPGGVVKRTQTTSQDGKVVAETTIMLKSYKQAE
jgi:hypothetical protein